MEHAGSGVHERRPGRARHAVPLQGTEEFVEFVGGVEIGFEFAGGEAFAQIVEAAGEEVERGGEDFRLVRTMSRQVE